MAHEHIIKSLEAQCERLLTERDRLKRERDLLLDLVKRAIDNIEGRAWETSADWVDDAKEAIVFCEGEKS